MIDFMLIVLNGEPWIKQWLKTYEPHANKIFIIEGTDSERFKAVPKEIRKICHTDEGHSVDNTREIIRSYPSNKITLIDENPKTGNAFWSSKNHMIKQINDKVRGNWVWQADCDEFLFQSDIERIKKKLQKCPQILVWEFKVLNFWKSASHILAGGWVSNYRRIFKWKPGKTKFKTHRPPTTNFDGPPVVLPSKLFHYNYLLDRDAKYKPAYHQGMYGNDWYENRWLPWTPENRNEREKKTIGPIRNWGKTGTVHEPNIKHPEFIAPIIQRLIESGKIFA